MTSPRASADVLSRSDKHRLTRLRAELLVWYRTNGRSFPWRAPEATDFQKICVELLLQRTRAETVARIYPGFL